MAGLKRVLVAYPVEFKCYDKLQRKLEFFTRNLTAFEVVPFADHNTLVARYASENMLALGAAGQDEGEMVAIDFAVVFEDERYPLEGLADVLPLESRIRKVSLSLTKVVNIDRDASALELPEYEYIGRGSYWGNPYSMYENGESREEVIRKYKYDFDFDKFPNKEKTRALDLRGKVLGCHCKPAACHGDILADYLNSLDDSL